MKVTIVGAGVVGSATGSVLAKLGREVSYVDTNETTLLRLRAEGRVAVTPQCMDLDGVDVVLVCVPTPSDDNGIKPKYLDSATRSIGAAIARCASKGGLGCPVIAYRSTVTPGTTRRLILALEDITGIRLNHGLNVCYVPEYLRADYAIEDALNPPLVLIGGDTPGDTPSQLVAKLFSPLQAPTEYCSYDEAELEKLVHNVYNAVKIAFFNETRQMADILGLDADLVFKLVARTAHAMTKPEYGIGNYGPFGGACLPKDTRTLNAFAQRIYASHHVLDATIHSNRDFGGE